MGVEYAAQEVKANVAASQTDSVLRAGVVGKKIRVLQVAMEAGATATDITFNSKGSGAGTAISPLFANGVRTPAVLPFSSYGWFTTNVGEALTCTTGAGSSTGILLKCDLV